MDRWIDAPARRPASSSIDAMLIASRVKLVRPFNAVIIAGLAVACWIPVAVSAYLLAG